MCTRKKSPSSLIKHLLSLRVTLSTAKISWVTDFLELSGLDALQAILVKLSRQTRELGDINEQIITVIIKCLRVLMNIDVSLIPTILIKQLTRTARLHKRPRSPVLDQPCRMHPSHPVDEATMSSRGCPSGIMRVVSRRGAAARSRGDVRVSHRLWRSVSVRLARQKPGSVRRR